MLLNLSEITLFASYGGDRSIFIFENCTMMTFSHVKVGWPELGSGQGAVFPPKGPFKYYRITRVGGWGRLNDYVVTKKVWFTNEF
jgi:hypothetical protein